METLSINDVAELSDVDFEGIVSDPTSYPDPASPKPLDQGTYQCKIVRLAKDADDSGNWKNPTLPTLIMDFEVVRPDESAGRKANFIRISSRTWLRGGEKVSELGDVIRAFDREYKWTRIGDAYEFLIKHRDRGTLGKFRFGWRAFDSDFLKSSGADQLPRGSQEKKDLYKQAEIKHQRNFATDGTVVGPSGKTLKAKLYLLQAYPAAK